MGDIETKERDDAPQSIVEARRTATDPDAAPEALLAAAGRLTFFGLFREARDAVARLDRLGVFRQDVRQLKFAIDRLSDTTPEFQEKLLVNSVKIARDPVADPERLLRAADRLIRWGALDDADRALATLEERGARGRGIRSLQAVSRQLRRSGILDTFAVIGQPLLRNLTRPYEAMLSRHAGTTDQIIIVFSGAARQFYVSISVLHHFLKRFDAHVIYLSDHRSRMFFDGLTGHARGYADMLDMLNATIAELGASSVHVLAKSAGGFMGLRTAADVGAATFLGLSIRTDMSGKHQLGSYERQAIDKSDHKSVAIDLRPYLAERAAPGRIYLCCGDANMTDREHTEHLRGLPNVTVDLVEGYRLHDPMMGLLARGEFEGLLQRFVTGAD